MILVGGLGLSGLGRVQREQDKIRCQNSLRQLGNSLVSYSGDHNGRLPQVNDRPPMNLASSFVPMLQEGGYLPSAGLPNCPLVNVAAGEPNTGGYAYSLGYRGRMGSCTDFALVMATCGQSWPIGRPLSATATGITSCLSAAMFVSARVPMSVWAATIFS